MAEVENACLCLDRGQKSNIGGLNVACILQGSESNDSVAKCLPDTQIRMFV